MTEPDISTLEPTRTVLALLIAYSKRDGLAFQTLLDTTDDYKELSCALIAFITQTGDLVANLPSLEAWLAALADF